jgi:hypothetical protein
VPRAVASRATRPLYVTATLQRKGHHAFARYAAEGESCETRDGEELEDGHVPPCNLERQRERERAEQSREGKREKRERRVWWGGERGQLQPTSFFSERAAVLWLIHRRGRVAAMFPVRDPLCTAANCAPHPLTHPTPTRAILNQFLNLLLSCRTVQHPA